MRLIVSFFDALFGLPKWKWVRWSLKGDTFRDLLWPGARLADETEQSTQQCPPKVLLCLIRVLDREIVSNYCSEVRELGYRLEELISESLGLEKGHIRNVLGEQGQHMAVNFYPACPEPELTYGLPGHTDPNALTILLQDLQVAGLQVLKDGKWLAINPIPGAFVVNIGDQLQVR